MNTDTDCGPNSGNREWRPAFPLLWVWIVWAGLLAASLGLGSAGVMSLTGASAVGTFAWVTSGAWLIGAAIGVLHFRSLRYTLDENYVTKASGRLWWHRRAVPLDQITSLDVRQGPVERLFGMGQVWIFTPSAGDMGPEEKLIGVKDADHVREAILAQSRKAKRPPRQSTQDSDLRSEDLHALLETIRDSLEALRKSVPHADREGTVGRHEPDAGDP